MDIGHRREKERGRRVPVIDGKLNGRMDGGLTPERPLNSNLFYRPPPTSPVNFNIRTRQLSHAVERLDSRRKSGRRGTVPKGEREVYCDNPQINSAAAGSSWHDGNLCSNIVIDIGRALRSLDPVIAIITVDAPMNVRRIHISSLCSSLG